MCSSDLRTYIRKARNGEAIAFLLDIKMKQETYFMAYSRYVSTAASAAEWYPATLDYLPYPWVSGGGTWDCSTATGAIAGFCALGITPASPETFFQYQTIGWSPGTTFDPRPYVNNASRRWWFARAQGFAGTGTNLPFEFRLSSEHSEIIEIGPE